jgi:glutamine---fructose-6-phosphate transaminase (isomerizing)
VTDRVEALRADIERGPEALEGLLDAYLAPAGPLDALDPSRLAGRRIAFVGLGSSLFASMDAASELRAGGVAAWAEFASGSGAPPSKDLVLVAVSASGRTPEVVELAERHRGTSLVIAVTNGPDSPLAASADVVLPLLAGIEAAGISTLTYRATVVVLGLLAGSILGGGDAGSRLHETAARLTAVGTDGAVAEWIGAAADVLDGAPSIDVIGPASRLGSVSQAALMLREAPRLPAHAFETSDWLHTAVYLALPGHRAVLVAGSPADTEVLDTIRRRGGAVVVVDEPGFAASAMVDRLALELWRRVSAQG